jgi:hypothetical protein
LAVAEYMNGILFVAPNTLLRDLEVPDNPTKRVSISYFSTRNISDESILLENSDAIAALSGTPRGAATKSRRVPRFSSSASIESGTYRQAES